MSGVFSLVSDLVLLLLNGFIIFSQYEKVFLYIKILFSSYIHIIQVCLMVYIFTLFFLLLKNKLTSIVFFIYILSHIAFNMIQFYILEMQYLCCAFHVDCLFYVHVH